MANLTEVTEKNFDTEVLQAAQLVLVDFWAPWCAPCRMIAPVMEELALENAGTLKVVKISIDESPKLAAGYGVSSIPTVMIFKDGEVVDRFVGVQPKVRLQGAIEQARG
jgi:thioredoxin 1